MPDGQEVSTWMAERGYKLFDTSMAEGKCRITAAKADLTIRAVEGDDGTWGLADITPLRHVPQGTYLDVRPRFPFRSRETFTRALDELEGEEEQVRKLREVLTIALDPYDSRIQGHEEDCCGVVLDTWTVDLGEYGMTANDDGRWIMCGNCGWRDAATKWMDPPCACVESRVRSQPPSPAATELTPVWRSAELASSEARSQSSRPCVTQTLL